MSIPDPNATIQRPATDRYGKLRPAKNVQPGWHLWTTEGWFEVSVYMWTENIITGQKLVRFLFADGTNLVKLRGDDVLCRTAAEAKRAARAEAEASA
jgi:hypothetical protein